MEAQKLPSKTKMFHFKNERGEILELSQISKTKKIKSIMFLVVKTDGKPEKKIISDETGILVNYVPGNISLIIQINSKSEFDKLTDIDEKYLLKREDKSCLKYKYILSFHIENLKVVNFI